MEHRGETVIVEFKDVAFIRQTGCLENGGSQLAPAKVGEEGAIMVSAANRRRDLRKLLKAA
jgi:hypothetical protein